MGDVIVSVDGIDVKGVHSPRAWTLLDVLEGTRLSLGLARGETVTLTAGPPR